MTVFTAALAYFVVVGLVAAGLKILGGPFVHAIRKIFFWAP